MENSKRWHHANVCSDSTFPCSFQVLRYWYSNAREIKTEIFTSQCGRIIEVDVARTLGKMVMFHGNHGILTQKDA